MIRDIGKYHKSLNHFQGGGGQTDMGQNDMGQNDTEG